MEIAKGYKGFMVDEETFVKTTWTVKLVGSKEADDKKLALFHNQEAVAVFVEALENKGLKNLTDVRIF